MEKNVFHKINVEPLKLFRPVLSGLILNAFYSAMILEKSADKELTEDDEARILKEVLHGYGRIDEILKELEDSENKVLEKK